MKRFLPILILGSIPPMASASFTEPSLVLYGRVLQAAGGTPHLLHQGQLTMVLRNKASASNQIKLSVPLRPTGTGTPAAFSYAVSIPLKFDLPVYEQDAFIEVKGAGTQVEIVSLEIDGVPALTASAEDRLLSVTQEGRSAERRMDIVASGTAEDADEDGMPQWWESQHQYNDLDAGDAAGDSDQDGLTNLAEFLLGTDPHGPNTEPLLLTPSVQVTREGTAGLPLSIVDSDTPSSAVVVTLTDLPSAFTMLKDGLPLDPGSSFTRAEVEAGLLTLRHNGTGTPGTLGLRLSDGTHPPKAATVEVVVFDPGNPAGIQAALWLDARSLALANGQPVAAWNDRSGRLTSSQLPRVLAQAETSRQPVFQTLGGRPAVSFDGTGRHLLASDASLPATTKAVFLYQSTVPHPTSVQTVLQSNSLDITLDPFDGPVGYPGAASFNVGAFSIRGFRTPGGQATLHAWRLTDDEGFALSQDLYDGGRSASAGLRPTVVPALGARVRPDPSQPTQRLVETPFQGRIHELITYDRVLPERFAGQVENYLLSRWRGAVIWDGTESLTPLTLTGSSAPQVLIGGFGDDRITAGQGGAILSGGAGSNVMRAGSGADVFRYRSADSGSDRLLGMDLIQDRLDLSGRFAGKTGAARDYIQFEPFVEVENGEVRLTTLIKLFPEGPAAEPAQILTLEGHALSQDDLGRLMGEGVVLAGELIPGETVNLQPLAVSVKEAPGKRLEVVLQRSGNRAHAEEVPLTFSGVAGLWRDFGLEGTGGSLTRPTIRFERGAAEATFAIVPAVDALDEPDESLQIGIVPRPRNYQVTGTAPVLSLLRSTGVYLASAGNVIASQGTAGGVLTLHRLGDKSGALEVALNVSGDALAGIDYQTLPVRVILPDGASTLTVPIQPRAGAGPGVKRLVVSVSQGSPDYISIAPWSAEFLIVPGDPLALGGFAAWRSANDPAAGAVPLTQYANQDRNGDGRSNFLEYSGGVSALTFSQGPQEDQFEIALPSDLPDVSLVIERTRDLLAWEPLPGLSGEGVYFENARGFVRRYARSAPALRPPAEFYRVTSAFRELRPGLSAAPGLFAGNSLPLASAGVVPWEPGGPDGGLAAAGLAAGESTLLAVSLTGPLTLRYEWFLSNSAADSFTAERNGQPVATLGTAGSWTPVSLAIPAGEHRLVWRYSKIHATTPSAGSAGLRGLSIITP